MPISHQGIVRLMESLIKRDVVRNDQIDKTRQLIIYDLIDFHCVIWFRLNVFILYSFQSMASCSLKNCCVYVYIFVILCDLTCERWDCDNRFLRFIFRLFDLRLTLEHRIQTLCIIVRNLDEGLELFVCVRILQHFANLMLWK